MLVRFRAPSLVFETNSRLNLWYCSLAVAVTVMVVFCVPLYANHGSISFRCGTLATASEPYLDNSNRFFQRCSWHLGIGTRTWGETCGIKACMLRPPIRASAPARRGGKIIDSFRSAPRLFSFGVPTAPE
jgi:hypothetical protein